VSKKEEKKVVAKDKEDDNVVKPKQVKGAYIYFFTLNYKSTKEKNPSLTITEITKQTGEKWNKMTEKEKQPFVKLHEQDVIRHEKEMNEFKKLGYFTNSDGVKSTFLTKKGKAMEFEAGTVMPKKVKPAFMFFHSEYYKANYKPG